MKTYQIQCAKCGYRYKYRYKAEVSKKPEWEICPNCGYGREFNGEEVKNAIPEKDRTDLPKM